MKLLIINGPNLNMLGKREPEIYGHETLYDINTEIIRRFPGVKFEFFQSNHEGAIIDKIQETNAFAALINAGGYTHTSVSIRDAIACRPEISFVEVHLTDPSTRESFRHLSYLTDVCAATFSGFGKDSYLRAIDFLLNSEE